MSASTLACLPPYLAAIRTSPSSEKKHHLRVAASLIPSLIERLVDSHARDAASAALVDLALAGADAKAAEGSEEGKVKGKGEKDLGAVWEANVKDQALGSRNAKVRAAGIALIQLVRTALPIFPLRSYLGELVEVSSRAGSGAQETAVDSGSAVPSCLKTASSPSGRLHERYILMTLSC